MIAVQNKTIDPYIPPVPHALPSVTPFPPHYLVPFPPRAFKIGGRARQQTGATLTCTRHGRVRGLRADCDEQLVFGRRATNGYFIPDPSLFVVTYLNWEGEGGVCNKEGMWCGGNVCLPMLAVLRG